MFCPFPPGLLYLFPYYRLLEMMHHSGVPVIRHLCTPVFLIYAQRYCTIYMALRPPELEQSSLPPSIPSKVQVVHQARTHCIPRWRAISRPGATKGQLSADLPLFLKRHNHSVGTHFTPAGNMTSKIQARASKSRILPHYLYYTHCCGWGYHIVI